MNPLNEQLLKQEGHDRRRTFRLSLAAILVGVVVIGAGVVFHRIGGGGPGDAGVVIGIGVGVSLASAIVAWKLRPWDERWRSEPMQMRRDRLQNQRTNQLWAFPTVSLVLLYVAYDALGDIRAGETGLVDYLRLGLPVLYAWLVLAMVMGWDKWSRANRRFLDDELTRDIRARALGLAFVVLMMMTTAALAINLWVPDMALMFMIVALTVSGAAAGFRFAWLDREASRTDVLNDD